MEAKNIDTAIICYKKMYIDVVLLGLKELHSKEQKSMKYKRLNAELTGARAILEALGVDVWSVEQSVKIL